MENVQRNACIYGPVEFAAAMIHVRFAGDKLREGLTRNELREKWVTLRETLF